MSILPCVEAVLIEVRELCKRCLFAHAPRWPESRNRVLAAAILLGGLAGPAQGQSNVARAQAAKTTASNSVACKAVPTFYWEIGDRNAPLASGSRGVFAPRATDALAIYSASKWIFGAYVYQRRGGQLSAVDVRHLNLSSGHTGANQCMWSNTVSECRNAMGPLNPPAVGSFHYAAGHLQQLAVDLDLGRQDKPQLASTVRGVLGTDIAMSYVQPQLASGIQMSTAHYGLFLRKILGGKLLLSGGALGSSAVCTYTSATSAETGRTKCPTATYSPTDGADYAINEQWSYSLGHWVESDPRNGDGAFSSPGAAGFYPWIDSSRSYYGVLARRELSTTAAKTSVHCGRLIRKAWLTGIAQP